MKKITLFSFILIATFNLSAQNNNIQTKKISFITNAISLSVDEAQKFWPLYNECESKVSEIRKQKSETLKSINNPNLSEVTAKKLSDKYISLKEDEANIRTKYHNKYKSVLSEKKIALLYKAEHDFNVKLLKEIKN